MKLNWIGTIVLLSMGVSSCGSDTQEVPVEGKVAFQNEHVRVLRFDLEPGEALQPHTGKRRVVYSLGDYELDWTEAGEALGSRTWNKGDVHAHDATVHEARNTGDTTASFVIFERLDTPLPSAPMHEPMHDDGAELPADARSLLDNPDFHVLEVELEPGDSQTVHSGGWRVIYSLTDYTIEWEEDGTVEQNSWSAGGVHWHKPTQHAARNTGDTVASWVVVGFKN